MVNRYEEDLVYIALLLSFVDFGWHSLRSLDLVFLVTRCLKILRKTSLQKCCYIMSSFRSILFA